MRSGYRPYSGSVIGLERLDAIATREIAAARKRLIETTISASGPDLREAYFRLLARYATVLKDRWGVAEARARSAADPNLARPYEDAFRQAAAREAIERGVFARPSDTPVLAIPDGVVLADRLAVTLRNLRRIVEARGRDPSIVAPSALQRHWQAFADAIRRSNQIAQAALAGVRAARTPEEAARVDPFADVAPPPDPEPTFEAPEEESGEEKKSPSLLRKGLTLAALTAPVWGSMLLFRR
jgi:hypothetical protein